MSPSLRYFDNIRYGNFEELEVLVDPADHTILVSQSTLVKMIGWDKLDSTGVRQKLKSKSFSDFVKKTSVNSSTAKTVKPSQGNGLTGVKSIDALDSLGRKHKVNALPFDTFLQVVYWEAFEGKGDSQDKARALLLAGFADSFSSLVLEQCGIKLTESERQETVSFYLTRYHAFQDWVRDTHLAHYGKKPTNDYYRSVAVTINQHLFKKTHFFCDRLSYANNQELREIENFQMSFMKTKASKKVNDPLILLKTYIDLLENI